jgi:hypothetical protein
MQNPEHQKSKCSKCHAGPGEPCVTLEGWVAEKVHYGRPSWLDPAIKKAHQNVKEALRTSRLRPTKTRTGIWAGSEFVNRDYSVPYGAWYCPCGEAREALGLAAVLAMNYAYAEHAPCRT